MDEVRLFSASRALADAAVVGFALVFVVAAGLKVTGLSEFAQTIARQHGITPTLPHWIAVGLAFAQLLMGSVPLWLLLVRQRSAACIAAGVAMTVMTMYAAWMVVSPPPAPAPCGYGSSNRLFDTNDWRYAAVGQCLVALGFGVMALGTSRAMPDSQTAPYVGALQAPFCPDRATSIATRPMPRCRVPG